MSWKPNKNQISWGVTVFLVLLALLICYFFMFYGSLFVSGFEKILRSLSPIILGAIIAMILTPYMNLLERHVLAPVMMKRNIDITLPENKKYKKRVRKISLFICEITLFLVFVVLCLLIIPQTITSVREISSNFSNLLGNANETLNESLQETGGPRNFYAHLSPDTKEAIREYSNQLTRWITTYFTGTVLPNMKDVIISVYGQLALFIKGFFNVIVGIIVSIYILYSKERMASQFKKVAYAFFPEKIANLFISELRFMAKTFTSFFGGKLLDSLLIGIICWCGTMIIGTPYAILVSVLVGVTNIIPFFGPYIGAIVGVVLIVLINPWQALYFLVFVLILQQFDGNVLGPKILGDSTGLSSFWVIFAILLFGGLFGVVGWIVGVPIVAIVFAWIHQIADHKLSVKNMPVHAFEYEDVHAIQEGKVISKSEADGFRTTSEKAVANKISNFVKKYTKKNDDEGE